MQQSDLIRLRHMLKAAQEAVAFSAGRSRTDFRNDRMLTLAVVKCIEIIGEAASKVTIETREFNPEIPWVDIVGMRNRLIHVYFAVDFDRVFDTVTGDLPSLILALEKALAPPDA